MFLVSAVEYVISKVSRGLNRAIGGIHGESLSGRSFRQRQKWQWRCARNIINGWFFWQEDHCKLVHEREKSEGVFK